MHRQKLELFFSHDILLSFSAHAPPHPRPILAILYFPLSEFFRSALLAPPNSSSFLGLKAPNALDLDLKKLKARAFDRADWAGPALRRHHQLAGRDAALVKPLQLLYDRMFVPPMHWPFNIQDVVL
jgi:hypothetical protein